MGTFPVQVGYQILDTLVLLQNSLSEATATNRPCVNARYLAIDLVDTVGETA
jgi:hypothetical protein